MEPEWEIDATGYTHNFITHTVQMEHRWAREQLCGISSFITHTVQMEPVNF